MGDIIERGQFLADPWILLSHYGKYDGLTRDAFNGKVRAGKWLEGKHWIKDPDGKIRVNWVELQKWKTANYDDRFIQQASNF